MAKMNVLTCVRSIVETHLIIGEVDDHIFGCDEVIEDDFHAIT